MRRTLLGLCVGIVSTLALLLAPAASNAAGLDLTSFHLSSALLFVNENAGSAQVTIERTDTAQAAQVRYITTGVTAVSPYDYTPENDTVNFVAGQSTATVDVPIVDHGIVGLPKTLKVALYGPSNGTLGLPSTALLTIINNDPIAAADPANPLATPAASTSTNPLSGAKFYVAQQGEAWAAAQQNPAIDAIADQPGTARFGAFSYPNAELSVSRYLARAQQQEPGTVPMLTTYRILSGHCGNWSDNAAEQQSYKDFINGFAEGIGSYKAVLFLEQDSLITVGCLSKQGLAVRMQELNYAINTLKLLCPHLVIYLDAGAADAVNVNKMAGLLKQAGVAKIQGFFLNSTHFDWASKEIAYGEKLSQLTGGKHFVVNTGESGRGPLIPKDRVHHGNEVLCNPPGRGLGPKPTTNTGFKNVDAFAWLDNPGGSSGACVPGAPRAGVYWPAYALMLIKNADYNAT